MKIQITMKTPDAFDQVKEEIVNNASGIEDTGEHDTIEAVEREEIKAQDVFKKFFLYGECVTLELDTEAKTLIAMPIELRKL